MDFNKAIELNPNIPRTYYDGGYAYHHTNNFTQAEEDYW